MIWTDFTRAIDSYFVVLGPMNMRHILCILIISNKKSTESI